MRKIPFCVRYFFGMKTKPFLTAFTGALMLTKRLRLPDRQYFGTVIKFRHPCCAHFGLCFFLSLVHVWNCRVQAFQAISGIFAGMKTKPFVSAVIGALMLTKRLQFPDQQHEELCLKRYMGSLLMLILCLCALVRSACLELPGYGSSYFACVIF